MHSGEVQSPNAVKSPNVVKSQIQELEKLRSQTRVWRMLSTALMLVVAVACIGALIASVRGLTQPGPTQQEFTEALGANLQRDVVPNVQSMAGQTLTELRPEVEKEFSKMNKRVPEMTDAALKEVDAMGKEMPQRAEKALDESFGDVLKSREKKIREMFPEATDDQINNLMKNLADEADSRMGTVSDRLFSGHLVSMNHIASDVAKIRKTEKVNTQGDAPRIEMAVLLLDVFRDDLKSMAPAKTGTTTVAKTSAPGSAVASTPAKAAPQKPHAQKPHPQPAKEAPHGY